MQIVHAAKEFEPGTRRVSLAIGFFDGVHLGHQQTIRQAIADARRQEALSLVITFDRHPNAVVAPARVHPLIYSLPQKLRTIGSLGVDGLLLIHFDEPFNCGSKRISSASRATCTARNSSSPSSQNCGTNANSPPSPTCAPKSPKTSSPPNPALTPESRPL